MTTAEFLFLKVYLDIYVTVKYQDLEGKNVFAFYEGSLYKLIDWSS